MIFLVLSILFSSSLLIFFKLFERFKLNSLLAISVNYIIAAGIGFCFLDFNTINRGEELGSQWLIISILLGCMFTMIFNLSRFATEKIGMGITSVAMKLGVLFPVIIGILCYHETFNSVNYLGLFIGFLSIYFINKPSQNSQVQSEKFILILPLIVWVGSGICDSSVQYMQRNFTLVCQNGLFSFITFLSAFASSFIFILIKKVRWDLKSIIGGICLGIPNFFSIYFLIKALDSMKLIYKMSSANLFMINNLAIVIASVFLGVIFFKERLTKFNIFGICLSLGALILISIK